MPWLLSPTNAIDDLKIGLYESGIVTRRLEVCTSSRESRNTSCRSRPRSCSPRKARPGQSRGRVTSCSPRVRASPRPKELAINRGNKYETRYGSTISDSFAYQQGRHVPGPRRLL